MRIKRCAWCADRFILKRIDQRTCSAECRIRHNRDEQNAQRHVNPYERSCVGCRKVFVVIRSDRRACSPECYRKLRYVTQDRWHTKACIRCGNVFTSKRADAKYCARGCFVAATYDSATATERAVAWSRANHTRVQAIKMQNKLRRKAAITAGPGVSPRDWARLVNRHNGRCAYCAYCGTRPAATLHMDHVVPLSRGGRHQIGNVLPACASCNLSKNARLLIEWKQIRGATWQKEPGYRQRCSSTGREPAKVAPRSNGESTATSTAAAS